MNINVLIKKLKETSSTFDEAIVTKISRRGNPFQVLISTILSLRTKDKTTHEASVRLFRVAKTPHDMIRLGEQRVTELIYPVGFYKTKAKSIVKLSEILINRFSGNVPADIDSLLLLPNVGRKTANLVLAKGFKIPAICVDTHVHRISNRLGLVSTNTPHETEKALRRVLPMRYWIEFNDLLVPFGQHICRPVSPVCSKCPVSDMCKRVGVTRSR